MHPSLRKMIEAAWRFGKLMIAYCSSLKTVGYTRRPLRLTAFHGGMK
jgi:hypothetical protein